MTAPAEAAPMREDVTQADRENCKHKFSGWREFDDGCGGETVCELCGIGAMAYTLSLDI